MIVIFGRPTEYDEDTEVKCEDNIDAQSRGTTKIKRVGLWIL